MTIPERPRTRREAFESVLRMLLEQAKEEDADFFVDEETITEDMTIDFESLVTSAKEAAKLWFPERIGEIEAYRKSQPIRRLLDLMGL